MFISLKNVEVKLNYISIRQKFERVVGILVELITVTRYLEGNLEKV